jgi:hypothetical protein
MTSFNLVRAEQGNLQSDRDATNAFVSEMTQTTRAHLRTELKNESFEAFPRPAVSIIPLRPR